MCIVSIMHGRHIGYLWFSYVNLNRVWLQCRCQCQCHSRCHTSSAAASSFMGFWVIVPCTYHSQWGLQLFSWARYNWSSMHHLFMSIRKQWDRIMKSAYLVPLDGANVNEYRGNETKRNESSSEADCIHTIIQWDLPMHRTTSSGLAEHTTLYCTLQQNKYYFISTIG